MGEWYEYEMDETTAASAVAAAATGSRTPAASDSTGSERSRFFARKIVFTRTLFDGVLTRPFVDLDPTEKAPAAPVEPQGEAPATPLEPHGEAPAAASGNQVWRLLATKYGGSL